MKKHLTIVCLFISTTLIGQSDFKEQFKLFSFKTKKLGVVEFCTFKSSINKKKPLMIFIHGSGNEPTFSYHEDVKKYSWKAFKEVEKYKDDFHVIFISKPGIPLFDSIKKDSITSETYYPLNKTFIENYNLDWRVKVASLIIRKAKKHLLIDTSKTLVIGHAQGGQVAAKLAVLSKKITHLAILNSNSLGHFYDYVLQERLQAFLGKHTFEQSQNNIDYYFSTFKDIYSNPLKTDKTWRNETYYRWSNFADDIPLENMLKLKIPIYVIASGKDLWNSTIMNTDYIQLEFLRKRKTNLTYKVYPNANHFLEDEKLENGVLKKHNLRPIVLKNIVEWMSK